MDSGRDRSSDGAQEAPPHTLRTGGVDRDLPRGSDGQLALQAMRAACDEAQAANRAKTAFLASVSHELRTPLNAIIGFAEMIARQQLGPIAEQRYPAYAQDIVASAKRLQDLLSDILDMARLENGRMPVLRETVALPDVVEEVLVLARARAPAAAAPIKVRIDAQVPTLWTDRSHLRQALLNLVSNALAFTPGEGSVTLSGYVEPSGDVAIAVADSGVGMTPDEVRRAVTRFGHANSDELTRSEGGIGLGLPLAKGLTQLLGGSMRVISARSEGTTVTLTFPPESVREPSFEWKRPSNRMAERARRLLGKDAA